jgi:hypothetical protein
MRTKEEVFESVRWNKRHTHADDVTEAMCLDAMDEYAKEVAIDYAHYLLKKLFPVMSPDFPAADANALFEEYLTKKK